MSPLGHFRKLTFKETITVSGNGELKIKILNLKKLPLKGTFASDDSFDRTRFFTNSNKSLN